MTPVLLFSFGAIALVTSFIAGIFGMAGGMLLMGGLLFIVSVPDAMVLHGLTQMTSNASRAFLWRRFILWPVVGRYLLGLALASAIFLKLVLVPDERIIFLLLGVAPFLGRLVPASILPQATRRGGAELCGFIGTTFQLLSGVAGPVLDVFFVRTELDRRAVVATKAACQLVTHLAKLLYFGVLIGGTTDLVSDPLVLGVAVTMAMLGTTLGRGILERLSDKDFRRYTWGIVMTIGAVYLFRGGVAFL